MAGFSAVEEQSMENLPFDMIGFRTVLKLCLGKLAHRLGPGGANHNTGGLTRIEMWTSAMRCIMLWIFLKDIVSITLGLQFTVTQPKI